MKNQLLAAALAAFCALPSAAKDSVPSPDGGAAGFQIDVKSFRLTTLKVREWALVDQKRNLAAKIAEISFDIQAQINGAAYGSEAMARRLGLGSVQKTPETIQAADAKTLKALADRATSLTGPWSRMLYGPIAGGLQSALVYREKMDGITTELGQVKSEIKALGDAD